MLNTKTTFSFAAIAMLVTLNFQSAAQEPTTQWAFGMGDDSDDYGRDIITDASGNSYITGSFSGTVDFDPGPGTNFISPVNEQDGFLLKLDDDGKFVWAFALGGEGTSVAIDPSGYVVVTGWFTDPGDFDPGPGAVTLNPNGHTDVFIARYSTDGVLNWARSVGGTEYDEPTSLAIDAGHNVYITGNFMDVVDFNPEAGIQNITANGTSSDAFVLKLDDEGSFTWVAQIESPTADPISDIAINSLNEIYITGSFRGSNIDFDPKGGFEYLTSATPTSYDVFVAKWDSGANFIWAKSIGSNGNDFGNAIATDNAGNVYIGGRFRNTVDFNPNFGTFEITSAGFDNIFVTKWSSSGNFDWASALHPDLYSSVSDIDVDANENVYIAGTFDSDETGDRIYLAKLDDEGSPQWEKELERVNNVGASSAQGIDFNPNGNIYIAGQFQDEVNFGCSAALLAESGRDIFMMKLGGASSVSVTSFTPTSGTVGSTFDITGTGFSPTASENEVFIDGVSATVNYAVATSIQAVVPAGNSGLVEVRVGCSTGISSDPFTIIGGVPPSLSWAKNMTSSGDNVGLSIAVDDSGNTYTTGRFEGTVDFDPGPLLHNVTAMGENDAFVSKFDSDGNLVWAKNFGGPEDDSGLSLVIDHAGNILVTGRFSQTADFDPGAGTFDLASGGDGDIFICKITSDGDLMWAKSVGADGLDEGASIDKDGNDNVYVTGHFGSVVDFDPGAGNFDIASATSDPGDYDMFILKLDTDGAFVWAKTIGGSGLDQGRAIAVDDDGNSYTTGQFDTYADFDPGSGDFGLSSTGTPYNAFILKLDVDGNLIWANNFGGDGSQNYGYDIELDASNDIFVTGPFEGEGDFDPGVDETILTSAGNSDTYFAKYDSDGNFIFAKSFGGPDFEDAITIDTDIFGNIFLMLNYFTGTVDVDPGTAVVEITSNGDQDFAILKYDAAGNFAWGSNFGGSNYDFGMALTTDASGNVYSTGFFQETADFNPDLSCELTLNAASAGTVFVQKLLALPVECPAITSQPVQQNVCLNATATFNVVATGESLQLQWQKFDGIAFQDILDGGGYTGVTTADLQVNTTGNFGAGSYRCVISSSNADPLTTSPVSLAIGASTPAPVTTGISSCSPGTFSLSATGGTNGQYRWYTTSNGGSPISGEVNSTYTTPSITSTASYFVSIDDGSCESARAEVVATVSVPPAAPITSAASRCGPGLISIAASGGTNGQYRWYTTLSGGTALSGEVNSTYTTPSISSTTSYFVSRHDGACESPRAEVVAAVSALPAAPATTATSRCGPGVISIAASGGTNGQYRWYTVLSGGTALSGEINSTYTTPSISSTTSYFVSLHDGACESPRAEVVATVSVLPAAPATTGASRCGQGALTLAASGGTNGQYRWYTTLSGGSPVTGQTNNTFSIPSITTTTSFFVSINTGCEGPRSEVVATINPLPPKPAITSNLPIGSNGITVCLTPATLMAPAGFAGYSWSNSALTTQEIDAAAGLYSVTVTDNKGCASPPSDGVQVTALVSCTNSPPAIEITETSTAVNTELTINLLPLISDPDGNLNIGSLTIITQPTSGALATIDGNGVLRVNYSGISFSGTDRLTIQVCDTFNSCTEQIVTIEVVGDIVVYDAFSPNGDGFNNFFFIQNIETIPATRSNHVSIYNRWGDVVFDVRDYNNTTRVFSGLSNSGNELISGTYFYKIEFASGKKMQTGYLTLRK